MEHPWSISGASVGHPWGIRGASVGVFTSRSTSPGQRMSRVLGSACVRVAQIGSPLSVSNVKAMYGSTEPTAEVMTRSLGKPHTCVREQAWGVSMRV